MSKKISYETGEAVVYSSRDVALKGVVEDFYDHHEWAYIYGGIWVRSRLLEPSNPDPTPSWQRSLERIRKGEERENSRRAEREGR